MCSALRISLGGEVTWHQIWSRDFHYETWQEARHCSLWKQRDSALRKLHHSGWAIRWQMFKPIQTPKLFFLLTLLCVSACSRKFVWEFDELRLGHFLRLFVVRPGFPPVLCQSIKEWLHETCWETAGRKWSWCWRVASSREAREGYLLKSKQDEMGWICQICQILSTLMFYESSMRFLDLRCSYMTAGMWVSHAPGFKAWDKRLTTVAPCSPAILQPFLCSHSHSRSLFRPRPWQKVRVNMTVPWSATWPRCKSIVNSNPGWRSWERPRLGSLKWVEHI